MAGAMSEELPVDDSVGIPLKQCEGAANFCYLILFNLNKPLSSCLTPFLYLLDPFPHLYGLRKASKDMSRRNNLGAILRSAAAFGVRQVLLVGRQGFKAFCKKSGQGAVPIEHFGTLPEAVASVKARHGELRVLGVEIVPSARSLHERPFRGPSCFMLGNERGGLSREQMELCDGFVYIPQFGGGVGSLNVACACSVVLYQFSAWASGTVKGLGVEEDQLPEMERPHGAGSFALKRSRGE